MQTQNTSVEKSILDANVLSSAVVNVVKHGKSSVEFDHILNYSLATHYKLNRQEQALWDLFWDFQNVKNACAVLNYCIENKTGISNDSFKLANKITPSEAATAKCANVKTFADYYGTLDQAGKDHLLVIAEEWLKHDLNGETSFDAFFVNGVDGETFKQGDYIKGYDSAYNDTLFTKVIIACPSGFITCADNGGFFTLPKGIKPQIVSAEEVDNDVKQILDDVTTKTLKRATEHKAVTLEKQAKNAEADKKRQEAADKKAANKKKRDDKAAELKAAQEKTYNELKSVKLDSKEKIDAAVKQLNKAKLSKEQSDEIRGLIKAANDKLPKSEKTAPKAEAPKAEAPKGGGIKVPREMTGVYAQLLQGTKGIDSENKAKDSVKAIKASKLPEDVKNFLLGRVEKARTELKPVESAPKAQATGKKVTVQQGANAPKLITKAPDVKSQAKGKNAVSNRKTSKAK